MTRFSGSLRGEAPARGGVTLIELLVVLAIIGLLMGLSWPAVQRLLSRSRVKEAAKLVRTELGEARLRAIESGTPQVFRFQPGTGLFEVRPKEEEVAGPAVLKSALEQMNEESDDEASLASVENDVPESFERRLPDGMLFAGQEVAEEPGSEDEEEASELLGISSVEMTEQQAWSEPVVFYPNGRTSNAKIRLTDGQRYTVDVSLRGLTATVRVGPISRMAESLESDMPEMDSLLGEDELVDTSSNTVETFSSEATLGPPPVEAQQ